MQFSTHLDFLRSIQQVSSLFVRWHVHGGVRYLEAQTLSARAQGSLDPTYLFFRFELAVP
jgi:hypothetical protein